MKITVLDFEQVARCYKSYVDGIIELEKRSEQLREELEGLQSQAEQILASEQTIVLDDASKAANRERIQRLQQEAMLKDRTFKMDADEEQRRLVNLAFEGITSLVEELAESNDSIEMVLNRSEVVYFKDKHDITDVVIDTLKTKDLYTDAKLFDTEQEG